MRWSLRAAGLPLALLPMLLPMLLLAAAEAPPAEDAYRSLPALPRQADRDGAEALEAAAVRLAVALRAVPLEAGSDATCATDRLRVSWRTPDASYVHGAHLAPVGPRPDERDQAVNGVVLCQDSHYGYMGFEAWRERGRWRLAAVPYVGEEDGQDAHDEHAPGPVAVAPSAPAPAAPVHPAAAAPTPAAPSALAGPSGPIEGYARYEPQRLCDPAAKPGTAALRNLLLGANPGTRNLGISRSCGVGGQSEHKEGRAFDWGVLAGRPAERERAEHFLARLMATDAQGNRHALARRMGVMYVIWNRRIWASYRAGEGWRPYSGRSAHTDHVHVSLSWAGAMGRTSFWSGRVDTSALMLPVAHVSNGSGTGTKDVHAPSRNANLNPSTSPLSPPPGAAAEALPGHGRAKRDDERRNLRRAERAREHALESEREARREAERAQGEQAAHEERERRRAEQRARDEQRASRPEGGERRGQRDDGPTRGAAAGPDGRGDGGDRGDRERGKAERKRDGEDRHKQQGAGQGAKSQGGKSQGGKGKGQGKGKGKGGKG